MLYFVSILTRVVLGAWGPSDVVTNLGLQATKTGELDRALDDQAALKAESDTYSDELNASNQKLTKATERNKSAQAELGGLEVKAEMFEEQVGALNGQLQQLQGENQQIEQLQVCVPEAPNWSQHRIPSTNRLPISIDTKWSVAHVACSVGWSCGPRKMVQNDVEVAVPASFRLRGSLRRGQSVHAGVERSCCYCMAGHCRYRKHFSHPNTPTNSLSLSLSPTPPSLSLARALSLSLFGQ